MYYSRITVDKNPKTVSTTIEKSLGYDGALTIGFLKDLGLSDDDEFCVYEHESSKEVTLSYTLRRLETNDEVSKRMAQEEAYNRRYEEYHASKK